DWQVAAQFEEEDEWAIRWAKAYAEHNRTDIDDWLQDKGIRVFSVVQWPDKGTYGDGSSVPRYHIAWGCGESMTNTIINDLLEHPNRNKLTLLFNHKVTDITYQNGRVVGCVGETQQGAFQVQAEHTVMCNGGINGNLQKVREVWDPIYGPA